MTNYICINGKKAELTEEQMRALGIELPKRSPFKRGNFGDTYYYIHMDGDVCADDEDGYTEDEMLFNVANYCTNEAIMEQRALHEILNRLLWRYSMEHDRDKIDWIIACKNKYYIYYSHQDKQFLVNYSNTYQDIGQIYFYNYESAENAIKEIIEPFMKAHPEFKF